MVLPKPIRVLIESFEKLPGIGPKTAQRLVFYLLHVPQSQLEDFAKSLVELKTKTVECSICFNVAEKDPCDICSSVYRDKSIVCVVEQPLDLIALEKSGKFNGVYHVLGGAINPLENIGPDEIKIAELIKRVKGDGNIKEVVLATDPDMEGEATAMFIAKKLQSDKDAKLQSLKVTRLGLGLPTGADIEYADETTLTRAMEGRREY